METHALFQTHALGVIFVASFATVFVAVFDADRGAVVANAEDTVFLHDHAAHSAFHAVRAGAGVVGNVQEVANIRRNSRMLYGCVVYSVWDRVSDF